MSEFLSETDAKNFLRLCKQGRLFEVQNWIAEGKSIRVPPSLRTNPLRVALGTGFHSLVELLAANEGSQEIKDECLGHAVFLKRLDFIELLVEHGAATQLGHVDRGPTYLRTCNHPILSRSWRRFHHRRAFCFCLSGQKFEPLSKMGT